LALLDSGIGNTGDAGAARRDHDRCRRPAV